MIKEIRGIHVAAMFVGGFSIIIAVNLLLAVQAVRTFPGLEVKNSYVASQSFDRDRAAQEALGWELSAKVEDDTLHLVFDGDSAPQSVTARLGRATHTGDDRQLELRARGAAASPHQYRGSRKAAGISGSKPLRPTGPPSGSASIFGSGRDRRRLHRLPDRARRGPLRRGRCQAELRTLPPRRPLRGLHRHGRACSFRTAWTS